MTGGVNDGNGPHFVLGTDQAPEFWQFLNGLRGDDLLVELIVNELDACSPRTEITFGPDRLICEGRGNPIDDGGWARLRKIKGAGHLVKAKSGLFGVKNHGLKACFTLGDDILVRSAGKQILQSLFANGPDAPAYPGVRVPPLEDSGAPEAGTRIEVPFRRRPFAVPHGEALAFPMISAEKVAELFRQAVSELPVRLLGIVRPGVLEAYELVLSHHSLGTQEFRFSCGRGRRDGSLVSFRRECNEIASDHAAGLRVREHAVLSCWAPEGFEGKPRFFQAATYLFGGKPLFASPGLIVEAAWPVDVFGRPQQTAGRLRYPVAYPGTALGSLTGMGVHYSGPFTSDTGRHELGAQAKLWNDAVITACDEAIGAALSSILLPRLGAGALDLVAPIPDAERLKAFTARLLKARALPAVDGAGSPCEIKRGGRLVVPVYLGDRKRWSRELAAVAPPGSALVDPRMPAQFLELLASGNCPGWNEDHRRFDETAVLERLRSPDAEHFPWRSEVEWRRLLGQPALAAAHLDALAPILKDQKADRPSGEDVHLPDGSGRLYPMCQLKRGVSVPHELMGPDVPPVIHPILRGHAVLKLEGWRLAPYAFGDMLAEGRIGSRPISVRRRFFSWLARHAGEILREDWPALKALPIWPATGGSLQIFKDLCLVEPKLGRLLGRYVNRPSLDVLQLCDSSSTRRANLNLRLDPTVEEVTSYYRDSLSAFPLDRPLSAPERLRFHAFEADLTSLCASKRSAKAIRLLSADAMALDRQGNLRRAGNLLRETSELQRLGLLDTDLLDRPSSDLDRVLRPAVRAAAGMALRALSADAVRTDRLLPRLRVLTSDPDPTSRDALGSLPCIPVDGTLCAPDELAFKGNAGDVWGDWKILIGGAGLPDDAQDLYRAAGVIRSFPTPETSRAYFHWLSTTVGAPSRNIASILRHISNKNGVGAWRLQPPELPCIPMEGTSGVELVTISEARRLSAVDDFPELADAIRTAVPPFERRIAIHSVASSSQPVADHYLEWGIPALSSLAKGPLGATGTGAVDAGPGFLNAARGLAAPTAARRFRKQLQDLDVSQTLIEPLFQRRLAAIRRVVVAREIRVHFKIGRRSFYPLRSWAVLTDEIWLDADGDLDDLLMKAVADLVFVKPRPRYLPAILKAALSKGTRDYRPPREEPSLDPADDGVADDEDQVDEARQRHPGAEPDVSRNKPTPGDLYAGGGSKQTTKAKGDGRKQDIAEDIQRRQLKAEHYAHHCQMDLATRSPHELAPVGSYAEFAENRRKIMEAHHPDKVGSSGSRHAGNLLILSRLNHERIGARLSRAEITEALLHAWSPRMILDQNGKKWLDGGVARTQDAITGEALPLFFTHKHRAYWLDMAGVTSKESAVATGGIS